jgi:hypothetical protein
MQILQEDDGFRNQKTKVSIDRRTSVVCFLKPQSRQPGKINHTNEGLPAHNSSHRTLQNYIKEHMILTTNDHATTIASGTSNINNRKQYTLYFRRQGPRKGLTNDADYCFS